MCPLFLKIRTNGTGTYQFLVVLFETRIHPDPVPDPKHWLKHFSRQPLPLMCRTKAGRTEAVRVVNKRGKYIL